MSDVILTGADADRREAERIAKEKETRDREDTQKSTVKRWRNRIEQAEQLDDASRKKWAKDRLTAQGIVDACWTVSANLISAIMDVLLAFIYAKDPDINVRPAQTTDGAGNKAYDLITQTIEIVVSRLFRDARLKKKAKRQVRKAMTVGLSWLKIIMQTRTGPDPIVESQINDLRENESRLKQALAELQKDNRPHDTETELLLHVQTQTQALEAKRERMFFTGLSIDVMDAEYVVVSPECVEIENYLDAPWIDFVHYKTIRQVCELTGYDADHDCIKHAKRYARKSGAKDDANKVMFAPIEGGGQGSEDQDDTFLRVDEIWSRRDGNVFTLLDGVDTFAVEPYVPVTGSRFYPAFGLWFHEVDGLRYPQSDCEQLESLQEEYASVRSNFREHRRRSLPGTIVDGTNIGEPEMKKITDGATQEYIVIKPSRSDMPLQNSFAQKPLAPVDPMLYDTSPITRDLEKVSGAQDAMQSSVAIEKTATEATIQDSGFGARTGIRRDAVEEMLQEAATYVTEIALQIMDQADAIKYAGPAAVWVKMTAEEAMTLFSVEIKAGSTGKPRAGGDREAWAVIYPQLKELAGQVGAARQSGQEWAAQPLVALMKESLKRLDDHADVDKFLPEPPVDPMQASMVALQAGVTPETLLQAQAIAAAQMMQGEQPGGGPAAAPPVPAPAATA